MKQVRSLIVNADDFGLSEGVNRGVVEAHERGIVTSASLMVRARAAEGAADYGRRRPELSVGLHLDLGEWVYRDDAWRTVYEVVALRDAAALAEETFRQLAVFRSLLGRDPTHIDTHQHVHREDPLRSLLRDVSNLLAVPVRELTPSVRYCGRFYGQDGRGRPYPDAIGVESLIAILASLPAGVTELGCHPALGLDFESPYGAERELECGALCDPRVRAALERESIELRSFHSFRDAGAGERTGGAS